LQARALPQAAQGDRPVGSLAAAAKNGAPSVLTVHCLHVPAHAARIVQVQRGSVVNGLGGTITMLYRKQHGHTRHDHAPADAGDAKKATTVVADYATRSSPSAVAHWTGKKKIPGGGHGKPFYVCLQ